MDEMLDAKSYNQNKHSVGPGKVRSAKFCNKASAQNFSHKLPQHVVEVDGTCQQSKNVI